MKYLILMFSVLFASPSIENVKTPTQNQNTINPIIGDISYIEKFGFAPNKESNEQERIKTHLEYVENLLRKKNTEHLNSVMVAKRETLLDYLKDYLAAGEFPNNYDYPDERRPCFIDKDKNICAVGYLVEQSAGIAAANKINDQFQYASIHDMKSDQLENWIENSGLSKTEVAMIQPTYGSRNDDKYVGFKYAIPSTALNLANIGFSTASISNWNNPDFNKKYARLGLISGSLTLGFEFFYTAGFHLFFARSDYQKKLRTVNLTTGVASIGINTIRLIRHKKQRKNKNISWNLDIQPGPDNQAVYGITLRKRL